MQHTAQLQATAAFGNAGWGCPASLRKDTNAEEAYINYLHSYSWKLKKSICKRCAVQDWQVGGCEFTQDLDVWHASVVSKPLKHDTCVKWEGVPFCSAPKAVWPLGSAWASQQQWQRSTQSCPPRAYKEITYTRHRLAGNIWGVGVRGTSDKWILCVATTRCVFIPGDKMHRYWADGSPVFLPQHSDEKNWYLTQLRSYFFLLNRKNNFPYTISLP